MAVSIRPQFSAPTADPGEWYEFMVDQETGEVSRLRLRPLTEAEEQGIAVKFQGKTVTLRAADGAVEQDWSAVNFRRQRREHAARALLETEGVAVTPADDEMARAYASFLGRECKPGEAVVIDGKLDARAVATIDDGVTESGATKRVTREMSLREFFLAGPGSSWICDWIVEAISERTRETRAREAGKAKT